MNKKPTTVEQIISEINKLTDDQIAQLSQYTPGTERYAIELGRLTGIRDAHSIIFSMNLIAGQQAAMNSLREIRSNN
jgi:ABC-type transporter Mla subunit MlaD